MKAQGGRVKLIHDVKRAGFPYPGEFGMRPRGGGNRMPVQAPVQDHDGWMSCSLHEVHYRSGSPCPMCDKERVIQDLARQIEELKGAIKLLHRDKDSLKAQVSYFDAMLMARDVLGDEDRLALKEFLYRWQRGEVIDVAVTRERFQSPVGVGVRAMVAGFRVDSDEHICSSVGGVAMARAFSDATKLVGRSGASKLLVKAMAPDLAIPKENE